MGFLKRADDPVTLRAIVSIAGISLFLFVGSSVSASATMSGAPNSEVLPFVFANVATLQGATGIPVVVFVMIETTPLCILYRAIAGRGRGTADQPVIAKQFTSVGTQMFKTESKLST